MQSLPLSYLVNPFMNCESMMFTIRQFCYFVIESTVTAFKESIDTCVQLRRDLFEKSTIRTTPGYCKQFLLCCKRAFKQRYTRYHHFVGQMCIHLGAGIVVSSVATNLKFVGPLPDAVCAIVPQDLIYPCTSPLEDNYQTIGNFLCFGTIFAAIAISTTTFGDEQVNYWRECAAGLKTPSYYFAKWIFDLPNMVMSACFFWLAFLIRFPNTNTPTNMYLLFLAMYWWSWYVLLYYTLFIVNFS
jgi:hypothetical protein